MTKLPMTPSASDSEETVHVSDGPMCLAKAVPVLRLSSDFADYASNARTARRSAKTARNSVTAAKTASFFKEFADVLHARMDSMEARVERKLEAIIESHSNVAEELLVMRESHSNIAEAQAHDAMALSRLWSITERHSLAHQHHITAARNLETALRSLDTSMEEVAKKAAISNANVKACKRACLTLDEQVSLLMDHSNAMERSLRVTSSEGFELDAEHPGRIVQTLTVPEGVSISTRAGTVMSSSNISSSSSSKFQSRIP